MTCEPCKCELVRSPCAAPSQLVSGLLRRESNGPGTRGRSKPPTDAIDAAGLCGSETGELPVDLCVTQSPSNSLMDAQIDGRSFAQRDD